MAQVLLPSKFRSGLQMFLIGLLIAVAAGGAWYYWGHHFWTALKGPASITLADLAKVDDPSQLPSTWVKLKFDRYVKSGYVMEETRNGGSTGVQEEYLIFQAGDRWMIASVPHNFKGQELSGQIWRQSYGLSREAAAKITEELKDVHHGQMFSFEFDASEDYAQKWEM